MTTDDHPPAVSIRRATEADRALLLQLMQLYCYDFSEFTHMELDADGRFADAAFIEDQLSDAHDQYIIHRGAEIAGFAIVTGNSHTAPRAITADMAQFFILRAHRRSATGTQAAHDLFERYPGPWEVRVMRENTEALPFWRNTIDAFTHGKFEAAGPEETGCNSTRFHFTSG